MRIGFDAIRAFHNTTGLGNYSRSLLRGLNRHYPDDELVLFTPGKGRRIHKGFQREAQEYDVRTPPWPYRTRLGRELWRIWRQGRAAARCGVQVYHGLTHELPRDIGQTDVRTVVTMHDLLYLRLPHLYPVVDRKIYDWKYKKSVAAADAVVAISGQTRDDLIHYYGVDASKIEVIYQPCDPAFSQPVPTKTLEEIRRSFELPSEFVLYVGTLEPRKNAGLLLSALSKLPPGSRPFVLFVGRKTAYQTELNGLVRRHQLEANVRFVHDVDSDQLPALYTAATLFCFPSRFEGFGIPILEALTCGTPVVTSTGSCFDEVGGPGAVYVDPDDPQMLAEVLDRLLGDPDERRAMVEAWQPFSRRFDREASVRQQHALYERLCGNG